MLSNPLQMQLKLHQKRAIQKTAEETDDLTGNKIADKITSLKNFSRKIIQKQMKKKIIDDLRLKEKN